MSVQVSYKNQFVLGIMLIVVVLVVVEGFANIWWYNINTCAFENNELFDQLDYEGKRQLCLENLELKYTETGIEPNQFGSTFYINSHGFRGPEITLDKPENTFRIFVVGGSTTFATGVSNNESPPAYLQEKFDGTDLSFKVEVINAGVPGAWSKVESKFVKERLLEFRPDLLIIYDGYNDVAEHSENNSSSSMWAERWIEICDLGKKYSFETIVTLQPFLGTGKKILSESESKIPQKPSLFMKYESYIKQLGKLDRHCTTTADLREIFDSLTESIFWDKVHVAPFGNQMVAENFYSLALPIVLEKGIQTDYFENPELSLEITDEDSNWILKEPYETVKNMIFLYKTPRVYEYLLASFENQLPTQTMLNQNQGKLHGRNFTEKDLENAIFNSNLSNANFANVDLTEIDVSGLDFSGSNLSNVNLSWNNLTQTKFVKTNLTGANLRGAILITTNLAGAILNNADLSVANLQGANLAGAILNNADLSVANLQGANLAGAELKHATLHAANLINTDLTNANLDGADLFGTNTSEADSTWSNFTQAKIVDTNLNKTNFVDAVEYTISDQNSCESLGGIWRIGYCELISLTVKKSDTLRIINFTVSFYESLDNFGKIIINKSLIFNQGGNISNHYGGVINIKSGNIVSNGTISNEGTIINGGEGADTSIAIMDGGIFYNKATGILFNGNGGKFLIAGVFYNNNIIFNDRPYINLFNSQDKPRSTNFTHTIPTIINEGSGIIFNKPGTIIHYLKGANITNVDDGIIFFDSGSIINVFSPIKNSNKIFSDCGAIIMEYAPIVDPVIEIPCN